MSYDIQEQAMRLAKVAEARGDPNPEFHSSNDIEHQGFIDINLY